MKTLASFVCICLIQFTVGEKCEDDSLRLVFSLARHGERMPDLPTWKNDPYNNEALLYPFGNGMLINKGIETSYEIGLYLRKTYGNFLGFTYYDGLLQARSSPLPRCKQSLLSTLAGVFPPKGINIWTDYKIGQYWQPIPIISNPRTNAPIMLGEFCPRFFQRYEEYKQTDEYKAINSKYTQLYEEIKLYTGFEKFDDVKQIRIPLYFQLLAQNVSGFKPPQWVQEYFPDKLLPLQLDDYRVETATVGLRRMIAGHFLKDVVDAMQMKINGTLDAGRKLYVYNAHEMNVASLLICLKSFDFIPPYYSSFVNLELHEIEGKFYVRIFYQNYYEKDPIVIKLPGCEEICPFDKFYSVIEENLAGPEDSCQI